MVGKEFMNPIPKPLYALARVVLIVLCAMQLSAHGQVLFDDSHSENVANANWIVDTTMPIPSPTISNITATTSERSA